MPKARILGTQRPRKFACSKCPLKNNNSEYINDSMAEIKSNLSVSVKFLNMFINFFSYSYGFSEYAPFVVVVSGLRLQMYYFYFKFLSLFGFIWMIFCGLDHLDDMDLIMFYFFA